MSRDSSVGIKTATNWIAGVDYRQEYFFLHIVQTAFGAHPASYITCSGGSVSGIKRPRRETDYSSPSSVEVKNGGAIPPLPNGAYQLQN
jgi:hypothetical protein